MAVIIGILLLLVALPLLGACGTEEAPAPTPTTKVSEFEIIRAAADAYASSGKPGEITAQELYNILTDDNLANDPFILSVRRPDIYAKGHIPGAI